MVPPQQPPNRRPGSKPDALDVLLDQQPERRSVTHPAVDGVPQAAPKRAATNPFLAALKAPPVEPGRELPLPPALPTEHAKTQRAPSTTAATLRATPATGQEVVRITEPSQGPSSAAEGQAATLIAERDRLQAKVAELERQARVRAESDQPAASFPPPVTPAPKPVVEPAPAGDAVIGWLLATATKNAKAIRMLVTALGLAGGAGAIKVATDDKPATEQVLTAELDKLKREHKLTKLQLDGALDREAALGAYVECLAEQQAEYLQQLLPAADRAGSAKLLAPWVDRCKARKPKP